MNRLAILHRRVRRLVLARRRLLAAIAAAVAVAAGLQASTAPPPRQTLVLTAAHDLAGGVVVRPADLTSVPFDPNSVPSGVITSVGEAAGRTTAAPVRAGEPITDVRLVGAPLVDGYPGTVAVPVRIGDPGAVRLLRVGDRIDIVAADPQGEHTATLVAADAPVIALPKDSAGRAGLDPGGLVVVAVSESTARDLASAGVATFLSVVINR